MKTKPRSDKADKPAKLVASDTPKAEKVEKAEVVMPVEKTVSTAKPKSESAYLHIPPHHYSDMAKIAAGLIVGVLALMVFLLSVGLQHPKPLLQTFLYISLVALGLSLLFYQLGQIQEGSVVAKDHAIKHATDEAKARSAAEGSKRTLGAIRIVQQLIFAIAIIGTIGFAIVGSQLFFVAAQTQTQAQ